MKSKLSIPVLLIMALSPGLLSAQQQDPNKIDSTATKQSAQTGDPCRPFGPVGYDYCSNPAVTRPPECDCSYKTLPEPPPGLLPYFTIPSPEEIKNSEGPVLKAAPEEEPPPEKGFPRVKDPGSFSISEHDKEKAKDDIKDLISDAAHEYLGVPTLKDRMLDALAAAAEKIENTTARDFLEKSVGILRSDTLTAVTEGWGILIDSEPTAGPELDYPSPDKTAFSAIRNILMVARGMESAFGDKSMADACSRLQNVHGKTRFGLNATQNNQMQRLIDLCEQQSVNPSFQAPVTSSFDRNNGEAPLFIPNNSSQAPASKPAQVITPGCRPSPGNCCGRPSPCNPR